MGVVVDLDALRGAVQAERVGDPGQELRLGRALAHLPPQRLARVGQRVLDQLALLAADRPGDLYLAAALQSEGFGEQLALGGLHIGQDQLGDRLIVVELAQEGAHDVGVLVGLVDAGKVGAVAPVLASPEEEHLHAGLAALGEEGEDVRLVHSLRVDLLLLGDGSQRPDAVAKARGALELHLLCRRRHLFGQARDHRPALAPQEGLGLVHQAAVVLQADQPGAGGCATLDLVQHARPRAALVDAVRTGPQQEGLLQRVQRPVDGAGAGEGAEIIALDRVGAAVLAKLRGRMLPADDDLGERLVVAQQDVEARLELLDQVDLEQQGFGFGLGGDELHRPGQVDHVGDALGMETALRVLHHPLLQRARLADVEHLAVVAQHAVDARRIGQALDIVLDQLGALQGWRGGDIGRHGQDIGESAGEGMAPYHGEAMIVAGGPLRRSAR